MHLCVSIADLILAALYNTCPGLHISPQSRTHVCLPWLSVYGHRRLLRAVRACIRGKIYQYLDGQFDWLGQNLKIPTRPLVGGRKERTNPLLGCCSKVCFASFIRAQHSPCRGSTSCRSSLTIDEGNVTTPQRHIRRARI